MSVVRANFYNYKAQFVLAIKIVQGSNDAESTKADRKIFYYPTIVSINVDYGSMPRRFDVFSLLLRKHKAFFIGHCRFRVPDVGKSSVAIHYLGPEANEC